MKSETPAAFSIVTGTVAQTMERNLTRLACAAAAFASAPMPVRQRFNKSGPNEDFAELIRQRGRSLCTRCARENEGVRVVARWQGRQVVGERLHQREYDAPASLARAERNLGIMGRHNIRGCSMMFSHVHFHR